MSTLAIDFGTSNCTAYVANADKILQIHLDGDEFMLPSVVFTTRKEIALKQIGPNEFHRRLRKARAENNQAINDEQLKNAIYSSMQREAASEANKAYWDQTFFSMLRNGQAIIFGKPALRAYFSDPLSGVLLKSPKTFLGANLEREHLDHFEGVIVAMLAHIKQIAEIECNIEISNALLGRPIRYHGTQGEVGNDQALKIMERAAHRAGIKNVQFELEPLAAAYEYERVITTDQTILVIDVGGGTTDCVMVRIGPTRKNGRYRDADVLGVSGDRVGGTDFDELLAWNAFMPEFGKNSLDKNGLPIPHSVLYDAISVRDIPAQLRFKFAQYNIEKIINKSAEPEKTSRLKTLHDNQFQHRLINSAELGKIALSERLNCTVPLKYIEKNLEIKINRKLLADTTTRLTEKIQVLASETISSAGIMPDVIFLTGGMAMSPIVREAIAAIPRLNSPIRSSDMLGTVGKGLGLRAQRIFELN